MLQRLNLINIIVLFLLFNTSAFAQSSVVSSKPNWEKVFGGKLFDKATDIARMPNGDILVLGYTESFGAGDTDFYVVKTNKNGEKEWTKTFGSEGSEISRKIILTADNEALLIGGRYTKKIRESDIFIVKIDKNGQLIWEKSYEKQPYNSAEAAVGTPDGGILITGRIRSGREVLGNDLYILRLDKNGDKLWEKAHQLRDNQYGTAISLTSDGGALVAGSIKPKDLGEGRAKDYADILILKIDSNGNKVWEKIYGEKRTEYVRDIAITKDDGAYVIGNTLISGSMQKDGFILRIDKDGQKLWELSEHLII